MVKLKGSDFMIINDLISISDVNCVLKTRCLILLRNYGFDFLFHVKEPGQMQVERFFCSQIVETLINNLISVITFELSRFM